MVCRIAGRKGIDFLLEIAAKKSADELGHMLHHAGEAAFSYAAHQMSENGIIMSKSEIEADMNHRASID